VKPPRLMIVLAIESAPRVISHTLTDAEATRLADWILSQPDLVELLDKALLSREERLRQQEDAV
jgi:hypothetical protein